MVVITYTAEQKNTKYYFTAVFMQVSVGSIFNVNPLERVY